MVQANRVTSDLAFVFIYKVRGEGGTSSVRSSQHGSINEWWARHPHHSGPVPDWFLMNSLGVYIGVKVCHFQETRISQIIKENCC